MMRNLLIVANCPSPNAKLINEAVIDGANHKDVEAICVVYKAPLAAAPDDVMKADGIIIGTTENFGYMSGQIKDFFERIYYPCLEAKQGLPYALFIKGGLDGTGARESMQKIITGLRWKEVNQPLMMIGPYQTNWLEYCQEFGMTMSAGLEAGVF